MNFLKALALTICLSSPLANAGNNSDYSVITNPAFLAALATGVATFATGFETVWNNTKTLQRAVDPNRQLPMHNQEHLQVNRTDCIKGVAYGLTLMTVSTLTLTTAILYDSHSKTCAK